MPIPATATEFITLVRQSALLEEKTLAAYLQTLAPGALPAKPSQVAGLLVRANLLTHFQAEQLLQGRWRRFSIGRYKVLEEIGRGGMGTVYLCEHKHMRRRVAVKVLPAALAAKAAVLERFYREARAVAALDHPNIVRAYDVDQDESLHFLAMEYVEGSTLQEMVKGHGPLGWLQAAHYMRQAAAALTHADHAGLVHRDVKPSNLIVDLSGTLKVLDLGLARFYLDDQDDLSIRYDDTTLGTPDFMAPEQALDCRAADIRSDIYSLGCTFYFCLTGSAPFPEGPVAHKLLCHHNRRPRPIREFRPDMPKELVAILDKAMAKRPKDRYQKPAELSTALTKLLILSGETAVGGMEQTLTESQRWRMQRQEAERRRWFRRLLAAAVAVVVGGLSWLLASLGRGNKTPPPKPTTLGREQRVAGTSDVVQF